MEMTRSRGTFKPVGIDLLFKTGSELFDFQPLLGTFFKVLMELTKVLAFFERVRSRGAPVPDFYEYSKDSVLLGQRRP